MQKCSASQKNRSKYFQVIGQSWPVLQISFTSGSEIMTSLEKKKSDQWNFNNDLVNYKMLSQLNNRMFTILLKLSSYLSINTSFFYTFIYSSQGQKVKRCQDPTCSSYSKIFKFVYKFFAMTTSSAFSVHSTCGLPKLSQEDRNSAFVNLQKK